MAFKVDISDLSVFNANGDYIESSMYDIICYRDSENQSEGLCVYLNPGYNVVLAIGKNDYYGYAKHQIESFVNVDKANIKLRADESNESLYNDTTPSVIYTGNPISPIVCLSIDNEFIQQNIPAWTFTHNVAYGNPIYGSIPEYKSYDCIYSNNVNVSSNPAKVIVNSLYPLSNSSQTLEFYILPRGLINDNIEGFQQQVEYDPYISSTQTTLSVIYNDRLLQSNVDYVVSYANNEKLGFAQCIISGIGNFTSAFSNEYQITGNLGDSLTKLYNDDTYQTLISNAFYKYTGNDVSVNVYVKLKDVLELNPNDGQYIVDYIDSDNSSVGKHNAILTSINDINGWFYGTSCEFSYNISTDLSNCTFIPEVIPIQRYSGSEIKPTISIMYNGKDLVLGQDYDIDYIDDNYVDVDEHHFNIVGKTFWLGTKQFTFDIIDDTNTIVYRSNIAKVVNRNITRLTRAALNLTKDIDSTITRVVVGNKIRTCEAGLLSGCTALTEVDFSKANPNLEIPESCFDGCTSLKNVVFPGNAGVIEG